MQDRRWLGVGKHQFDDSRCLQADLTRKLSIISCACCLIWNQKAGDECLLEENIPGGFDIVCHV